MNWLNDGQDWPNREFSRFVVTDHARWHVQRMEKKDAPEILLLHGSGATTHSFAALMPLLARDYSVTAIDLPGHGFTSRLRNGGPKLERVSQAVAELMGKENIDPHFVVGHSAGAAIAVQAVSDGGISPKAMVSINGAFYPFPGFAGSIFPLAAKLLFLNPLVPKLFSMSANNYGRVESLIDSTGSRLDPKGISYYQAAMQSSDHVEGTLAMMANWNLEPMADLLANLECPLLQIIGLEDGTIEPKAADMTADLLKFGTRIDVPNKGHLVHEEEPQLVADHILNYISQFN